MADGDGRDETGSSSGKKRVKYSQLEDHNQQPAGAAINNPNESCEEEEAREHQEAERTLQETNRESREEEDEKRDAATEEMNEDAENPLLHGEITKKRKTDHEGGSGVVTLTLVGGDLPGAQTGKAPMPMMMGGLGSEVGGGVSESAAVEWRCSLPKPACKYTYSLRMSATGQAVGVHGVRRRYKFNRAAAAAAASLDDNAAAANREAEEPPPRPAGQDEGALPDEEK